MESDAGAARWRTVCRDANQRLDLPERLSSSRIQGLWQELHYEPWIQPRRVRADGLPSGVLWTLWLVFRPYSAEASKLRIFLQDELNVFMNLQ